MKGNRNKLKIVAGLILALLSASAVLAQNQPIRTTYIDLGTWNASRTDRAGIKIPVPSVLYEPATPGEKSQIGILLIHPESDYLSHSVCTELAKRGYRVLCSDSDVVFTQFSRDTTMDGLVADVGFGVAYLRQYPGVRKVVLFGHDGGGALVSAYQNIAENGIKACQGPEKIIKCSDSLAGLPAADGIMLIDSNWGPAATMLFALDPAVESEGDARNLNPELNMYDVANGFSPTGAHYGEEFRRKFFKAELNRYNRLVQSALERLKAIEAGTGHYTDNEPFIVPGASLSFANHKLYATDIRLMSHTRNVWPLLHADGSVSTEVVHSVRIPENKTSATRSYMHGALRTTVRSFLNRYSVRVTGEFGYDEDSVRGIDWSSSYSNPPGNVMGITVPTLVMGMTGHWEFLASETIYENAKSADKTLLFVEGASHMYTTCQECEKAPGQFGDTLKTTYDFIDRWMSQKGRFIDGLNVAESAQREMLQRK